MSQYHHVAAQKLRSYRVGQRQRTADVHLRERLMYKKFAAFKRSFLNAVSSAAIPTRVAPNARRSTESGSRVLPALSVGVVFRFPLHLHKIDFALHNSLNCVAANFRQQRSLKQLSSLTVPLDNVQSS